MKPSKLNQFHNPFFQESQCNENPHLENLIGSHFNPVDGWTFTNIENGQFNQQPSHSYYNMCGEGKYWYGYGNGETVGSIKTTLNGCGKAILDYGNCYIGGRVDVNLNGVRIDYAWSNTPSKIVEFSYTDGSILEISEPSSSIIQFNKLSTFQCGC